MSVTNVNEIDKADVPVAGQRKHLAEVKGIGIRRTNGLSMACRASANVHTEKQHEAVSQSHGLVLFYRRFKLLVAECVAGILGVVDLVPSAPSATSRTATSPAPKVLCCQ